MPTPRGGTRQLPSRLRPAPPNVGVADAVTNTSFHQLCAAVARPCHSVGTRVGLNWLPRGVGVWACARPVVAPKGQPNVQLTGGSPTHGELVSTPVRMVHAASPPRRAASTRSRTRAQQLPTGRSSFQSWRLGARGNARARAGGERPRAPVPDLGVNRVYITHQNGRVEGAPAQRVSVSCAFLQ